MHSGSQSTDPAAVGKVLLGSYSRRETDDYSIQHLEFEDLKSSPPL